MCLPAKISRSARSGTRSAQTIPQMTQVAWEKKRDEIEKLMPERPAQRVRLHLHAAQYQTDFGRTYQRPGLFARFFVWVVRVLPKIGPFRALAFKTPSPEAERLFTDSFKTARERYRALLQTVRANRVDLRNTDFDTGQPTRRGEYKLADDTYAELVARLRKKDDVPPGIRADIARFYGSATPTR